LKITLSGAKPPCQEAELLNVFHHSNSICLLFTCQESPGPQILPASAISFFTNVFLKGALSKMLAEAEDTVVHLQVKGHQQYADELAAKVVVLAGFIGRLRTHMAKAAAWSKDEMTDDAAGELNDLVQEALTHKGAIQQCIKDAKEKL